MKLSLAWLRDHLEGNTSADEIARRLTAAGMNVELREPAGDDEVWDVDITSNRPDAMNHRGLAREAAAAGCGALRPLAPKVAESETAVGPLARLTVEDTVGCPRYCGRVIRGVRIGPSPLWLAERLERCGIRAINNVVDATNYVLLDLGHPLHAFDLSLLGGSEIRVRRARAGEKMTTLDGVERELTASDLVIADATHPVALAGIMGGAESEIRATTADLFLESAYFDPLVVRRTARRLGMSTEASHRFERGGDRAMARTAIDAAATLIVELAGGEIAAGVLDNAPDLPEPRQVVLAFDRLSAFAGCQIDRELTVRVLADLGFEPCVNGVQVFCSVPTHRVDIELAEDLYEEVLRHFGYDNVPSALPVVSSEPGARLGSWPLTERGRDALVAAGLAEAVTYAFIAPELESACLGSPLAARGDAVVLANPLSARLAVLRRSIVGGLAEAAAGNLRRGAERVLLGEVGRVFFADGDKVREEERLAVVVAGQLGPWDATRTADFWDLKGVLEAVLENLGVGHAIWRPACVGIMASGEAAEVVVDGRVLAVAGRLSDVLARLVDVPAPLWIAEVDLACAATPDVPIFKAIPRYPAVVADLTVRHKLALAYAELLAAIRSAAPAWLEDITPLVRYQGEGVAPDELKTTLRLTYRMADRSLTQDEVNEAHFALMQSLTASLGVSFQ
jgi:phenylalanyl-tRNA synthetase beta chain